MTIRTPSLAGIALDYVDRRLDSRIEIDLVPVAFVHSGKEPQLLDDALDSPESFAGAFDQTGQVGQAVIQVDAVVQVINLLDEIGLGLPEVGIALAIKLDEIEQVVKIAFQNRHVVAHERQRVVDLVGNTRHELSQAGHLLGLNHAGLGALERLVSLVLRTCQFLEHHVLFLELLLGPDPRGHIPENSLDPDGLAIMRKEWRLHDLDVQSLSLGRDVLLDDVQKLAAFDDLADRRGGISRRAGAARNRNRSCPRISSRLRPAQRRGAGSRR